MKNVILLVDDNTEMRNLFTDLLAQTQLKVVTFGKVQDAQLYLQDSTNRDKIKAIVSDLMMGPTDGLEFLDY